MKKTISFIRKHKHLFILLLLITVSAVCQLYQINRDFNGLHEYDVAQYSLLAKNMVKYGLDAKLGPVYNLNPLNGKFLYYLYHPFLTTYVYAFFFWIFGSTILIGRLISMFLFALGTVCLYLLVSKLWSRNMALWACFFYLFFPVSQYFGKFVGYGNVILPLIYLYILFYRLWVHEKKPLYFYMMLACFVLGCATDWYAYFLAPLTVVHYRYGLKNKNKRIFALIYIGALLFAVFLALNYYLTGSIVAAQPQWPAKVPNLAENLAAENQGFIQHALTTRMIFSLLFQNDYYAVIAGHLLICFTVPVMLMVLYFLFNYQRYKYFKAPTVYVLFIAALYWSYGLLNPKTLSDHNILAVFLSATFAAICAVVISKASRLFQVIFIAIFLIFSISKTDTLYKMNNTNQNDLMLGKVIGAISGPEDGIALSQPFYSPFTEYFGQRKILYDVTSWEKLFYIINSGKIKYFITNFNEFQGYLINKFPAVNLPNDAYLPDKYFISFDIQAKGIVPPRRRFDISFANNMKLIDFSYKRSPYGYLLLEYGWEKTGRINDKFMVFVHFEDKKGKILFGQDHFISNGNADMMQDDNKLIKESYVVKIPDNALNKKLSVYIGLYSPATFQRVNAVNAPAKDNRVYLGRI